MSDANARAVPPIKNPPVTWASAFAHARALIWAQRGRVAIGLVLIAIGRLAGFVAPATSKMLIDDVIGNGRHALLMPIALAVAVATIVQTAATFALAHVMGLTAQRAITNLRRRLHARILRLPVAFFDRTQSGVLVSRIMWDADGVSNLLGTGLAALIDSSVTAVFLLGVLMYLNWRLTLITIVVVALFGGGLLYVLARLRPILREHGRLNAELTGRLGQALGGIRVVKAYTAEVREEIVFAKGVHQLLRNSVASMTAISAATCLATGLGGGVGVIILLVGGRAVVDGQMTLGDLLMYLLFTGMLALPLIQISSLATQITGAFAGLDRIQEIEQTAVEDLNDGSRVQLDRVRGHITFDRVWFEYQPDTPVLKGITFDAPAGATTALVGSSGSGKSTLVSLVMAFNRPTAGVVRIDGHDLATLPLAEYRTHLGTVLQETFLFDGTIADNIRYGAPHAPLSQVREAGRIAHCDEFVDGFPEGYDTIVGERGIRLSGGQRQRVAIARAILADPRVLILDEATSNLDSATEARIQDALRALRRGRTTFVIAHRLSTIRTAAQILVLEAGQIVERGTHAELLAMRGRYYRLHNRSLAPDPLVDHDEHVAVTGGHHAR